ncbi:MAG: GIY-YIG nuclease family protein [Lachnospiraceae bacterium]|nr:GIY-YIG nuclease family protein [Lachnospiraceae bacterium]
MNYAYLVRCSDNSLYAGWTNNIEKRLKAHNAGTGAKYTKSRRPVTLSYFETFDTKSEAMKREAALKKMTHQQKEALVNAWDHQMPG